MKTKNEQIYFPKDKIDGNFKYYAISLLSEDGCTEYYDICGTGWVRFTEINGKRAELRKAYIIRPKIVAAVWEKSGEPFCVVNTIEDFFQWFKTGGHALIKGELAEEIIPSVIGPSPCFQAGAIGFTDVAKIPTQAFNKAPTKKLRMQIIERDEYKCRICGRRVKDQDHVDIELNVHHIRPFGQNGLTTEENLITICDTCHAGLEPHYRPDLFDLIRDKSEPYSQSASDYLKRVELYQEAMRKNLSVEVEPSRRKRKRN